MTTFLTCAVFLIALAVAVVGGWFACRVGDVVRALWLRRHDVTYVRQLDVPLDPHLDYPAGFRLDRMTPNLYNQEGGWF